MNSQVNCFLQNCFIRRRRTEVPKRRAINAVYAGVVSQTPIGACNFLPKVVNGVAQVPKLSVIKLYAISTWITQSVNHHINHEQFRLMRLIQPRQLIQRLLGVTLNSAKNQW